MRLLTVFGVDFKLNIFFILLFIVYWYFGVLGQALMIFSIVFLHEMGHVVVAAGYGIRTKEIELLPFGGVARLEGNIESEPVIEAYVAAAGPLTNAFLVFLGYMLYRMGIGNRHWLGFFIQWNIMLGAFNLLPAFPLDGGRVLRAFLSLRCGVKRATENAAALSQALGAIMAAAGAYIWFKSGGQDVSCLIISFFLIYSASKAKGSVMFVFMKFLSRKKEELFREGILLVRQVAVLETSLLKDVVKNFVPRKYHLVVVIGKDHLVKGIFTEGEIIDEMVRNGPETSLRLVVQKKK
ncbi:M50 family metallopeptidase [Phosphitispora sp. TUW77]|uniref:M50 family metallopeptidase n=1 Tax=Phosphitispora sp. TUW77 TaxID=3152361 RepID=UPI003AB36908